MSIGKEHKFDEMDKLVGGQPLWYWCLPFARRREIDAERAEQAGAKYVRDGSRDGLKPDGSLDDSVQPGRKRAFAVRISKKTREKIAKRVQGELGAKD